MLKIGSLVDHKYKILNEIGHGGMSTVYMAMNEKANKTWAIKEVRKNGVVDFETIKQGLVAETNLLKKLKHPNLPSIVDIIEEEDCFLIVMDYIEGNSLAKILREKGSIPEKYVMLWAKQLCDVLLYLHTQVPPIIYRDMKPGNIILKPDGTLILIDFGTAREFKEKNQGDTVCLGTVGYAAPEQFGGKGQTDARTDIYGLGATLYHLLTGHNPGKVPYEMKPICQVNPRLSGGLEQIITKCTQRNPQDRYQSAAELMYALEHYEELDIQYRKRQTVKCICFLGAVIFAVSFAVGGFLFGCAASYEAANLYENMLDDAAKTTDYMEKLEIYVQCTEIPDKCGEKEAYLGLIQTFKEDGKGFSREESNQLTQLIRKNKEKLQENVENYVQICFEVGKLYWYYFVEDDGTVNQAVRGKYSAEWFLDVLAYASEDYANFGMAKVYARIGIFYRDIALDVIEANDRGKYRLLYEDMKNLLCTVAFDEKESEIVRLELLEFARNAVWQYAVKFRNDGVTEEALQEVLTMISEVAGQMEVTTEKTEVKKENIELFMADARQVIENAFGKSVSEEIEFEENRI